jgi:hypothetical protein
MNSFGTPGRSAMKAKVRYNYKSTVAQHLDTDCVLMFGTNIGEWALVHMLVDSERSCKASISSLTVGSWWMPLEESSVWQTQSLKGYLTDDPRVAEMIASLLARPVGKSN